MLSCRGGLGLCEVSEGGKYKYAHQPHAPRQKTSKQENDDSIMFLLLFIYSKGLLVSIE